MQSFLIGSRAKAALAVLAIGTATLGGLSPQPAQADSAAVTRNIILGVAAAAAADIIYNNVRHKQQAANTAIGQTRNGGTVYADGRVVYPNGDVLYTGNGNGQPCSFNGTYNRCATPAVYYPQNYAGRDHGNHYGRRNAGDDERGGQKHHKHHDNGERDHGEGHGHGDKD